MSMCLDLDSSWEVPFFEEPIRLWSKTSVVAELLLPRLETKGVRCLLGNVSVVENHEQLRKGNM